MSDPSILRDNLDSTDAAHERQEADAMRTMLNHLYNAKVSGEVAKILELEHTICRMAVHMRRNFESRHLRVVVTKGGLGKLEARIEEVT